jgi:hypothetical protein
MTQKIGGRQVLPASRFVFVIETVQTGDNKIARTVC